MPKKLFAILLFSILSASLFAIPAALAQNPLKFSSAEIDLWPEYDRPSVLVIYRITLAADTSLPADLTVRIPAAVGDPNAVAVKQADGTLVTVSYDRQVSGEWGLIKFTATAPEVQLEYYDPGLTKDKNARHFEFRWPADYATDMLAIQVQQPFDATNISISPNLGGRNPGQDGLIYYSAQIGAIPAGQEFKLTVDYQKPTDKLSAESLKVQPGGTVAGASSPLSSVDALPALDPGRPGRRLDCRRRLVVLALGPLQRALAGRGWPSAAQAGCLAQASRLGGGLHLLP